MTVTNILVSKWNYTDFTGGRGCLYLLPAIKWKTQLIYRYLYELFISTTQKTKEIKSKIKLSMSASLSRWGLVSSLPPTKNPLTSPSLSGHGLLLLSRKLQLELSFLLPSHQREPESRQKSKSESGNPKIHSELYIKTKQNKKTTYIKNICLVFKFR